MDHTLGAGHPVFWFPNLASAQGILQPRPYGWNFVKSSQKAEFSDLEGLVAENCYLRNNEATPHLAIKERRGAMQERGNVTFPRIPGRTWWKLRSRFQQSVPTVSPDFLAAFLGGTEQSVTANILRPMKVIGLVDQDNKATVELPRFDGQGATR